ncbi:MAG: T9SS type A sorting domain-containing protein [bacterium]|nr:MAG: T9SS type A sorting domain-containing protein [bacterium]
MRRSCPLIVIVLLLTGPASAGTVVYEFSMDRGNISVVFTDGYELVHVTEGMALGSPGEPLLPAIRLSFVVPPGARITGARIESPRWIELPGGYLLYPVQPPRPFSRPEREITPPNESVYSTARPFPREPLSRLHTGNAGGFRIAGCLLTPLRYHPAHRCLEFLAGARVVLEYEITALPRAARTAFQMEETAKALAACVHNPHDLDICAPLPRRRMNASTGLEPGVYRHVIITSEALAPHFEPLRAWRTKHGFPSIIETVSDISARYPGWDDAERVRNFIIDASETWGALYFTLAGDVGVVPVRNCSQSDSLGGSYMPVDLYFSDLDGTWDSNGNHIYGEPYLDTLDMYSDVFVGRAPVETPLEAQTFVSKVLTYEKSPPAGYVENCLLPAVRLWPNYQGDIVNDSIAVCTPFPWIDCKLYESLGTISRAGVISAINDGIGFCHYSAHGNENGIYFANSDTVIHSTDALYLMNGYRLGIHNSIACISGAFDAGELGGDCFAEHLMNNPGGGAAAVIMNARVGLGTPPQMGPSEMLSLEFYRKVFSENLYRIGMAHHISKDVYVPIADSLWYYKFCIAELNLFGDPALAMWTAEPQVQQVEHPAAVPVGPGSFTVTVGSGPQEPLEGALVCIMSTTGDIYDHGETDAAGEITFPIDPAAGDTIHVTSTANNHLPYEGRAIASATAGGNPVSVPPFFAVTANPATTGTAFRFGIERRSDVKIRIYDVGGRVVRHLVARPFGAGTSNIPWNCTNDRGERVAPGIYFVQFTVGSLSISRKVAVLR